MEIVYQTSMALNLLYIQHILWRGKTFIDIKWGQMFNSLNEHVWSVIRRTCHSQEHKMKKAETYSTFSISTTVGFHQTVANFRRPMSDDWLLFAALKFTQQIRKCYFIDVFIEVDRLNKVKAYLDMGPSKYIT